MKQGDRLTACISTQVGCPLQCTFCATGLSGFVRNLSAGEIAGQVAAIEKKIGREINNVVYMGMGEPFLNTEAVLKSIRMLNDPKLRNLGIRHITVSTSGVIPGIRALAESGPHNGLDLGRNPRHPRARGVGARRAARDIAPRRRRRAAQHDNARQQQLPR